VSNIKVETVHFKFKLKERLVASICHGFLLELLITENRRIESVSSIAGQGQPDNYLTHIKIAKPIFYTASCEADWTIHLKAYTRSQKTLEYIY